MAEITVTRSDGGRFPSRFRVTVREGGSSTEHDVTLSAGDFERLGSNYSSSEDFIRACFDFLLEREPKESIMSRFDVGMIGGYFPEFERRIQGQ